MNNIRITSGNLRGRAIKSPKSNLTHPMGSREKIALFNMISDQLDSATILDAYAGSGALGIEALSRGAKHVVFVEKSPKIAQNLKKNLKSLDLTEQSEVLIANAGKFLPKETYDIIIADPPYDNFDITVIVRLTKYLKNDGVLVLSHPAPTPDISGLKLTKTKKYARANISIYRKNTWHIYIIVI